jgi:phosphate-selective porin OprO/OprP
MYELYDWACEYDFVNQINVNNAVFPTERDSGPLTAVTDLWLQLREVPILGIVRVGNQKDPYGYEHLTSSRWLNFMERSFAQDAFEGPFKNGFLPGIQVMNNNEKGNVAWQVGQFKNTTNPFGFSNSSGDRRRRLVHLLHRPGPRAAVQGDVARGEDQEFRLRHQMRIRLRAGPRSLACPEPRLPLQPAMRQRVREEAALQDRGRGEGRAGAEVRCGDGAGHGLRVRRLQRRRAA